MIVDYEMLNAMIVCRFSQQTKLGSHEGRGPTYITKAQLHAFRANGPRTVLSLGGVNLRKPTIEEKECAMGFEPGTMRVPRITASVRHRLMGNAFDLNPMRWIIMSGLAHQILCHGAKRPWEVAADSQVLARTAELGDERKMR